MTRLVVCRIDIRDFGSWHEGTLNLGGRGPVAIVGPNGSGKSTIASKALMWGLYGKAAPERMGTATRALSGRAVVRDGASMASVQIALTDGERHWLVTRTRKPHGQERIEVLDGATCVGSDQGAVDALIGAPYDVFCRTVVRGQGDVWSFAEAPDSRKREIIDTLSGGLMFGDLHERAKVARQQADMDGRVLSTRLDDLRRRISDPAAVDVVSCAEDWDRDRVVQLARARADVDAMDAQLASARADEAAAAEARLRRAEVMARRPALDIAPYDAALAPVQAEWTRLDRAREVAQRECDQLHAIEVGAECPTCGQRVGVDAPIAGKQVAARHASADLDQAAHAAGVDLKVAQEAHRGARAWLQQATSAWGAEVAALPAETRTPVQAFEQAAQAARRRVEEIEAAHNPWREAETAQRAARGLLLAEAEALAELRTLLAREEAGLDALVNVYAPKGVRASLGTATLAAIESAANRWLSVLSAGAMSIEFDPHRETQKGDQRVEIATTVRMRTPGGMVERELLQLSGGQRVRVNFAVDLGVAACFARGGSLALSLLVLDEAVFSNLDEDGKAAMVAAIHEAGVADVVVIDHDARISGSMPRSVEVEMVDGVSRWRTQEVP